MHAPIKPRWTARWRVARHLSDDALLRLSVHWRDEDGQQGFPAAQAHVATCTTCSVALAEVDTEVAALSEAVADAADAMISQDRLARQLEIIERRLDGQPGRLLRFPARARVVPAHSSLRRWVALAAACGLVFGLGAGRFLGPASVPTHAPSTSWARPATHEVPGQAGEQSVSDEYLLAEVDAALAHSMHAEFRVLDDLTPRVAVSPR